MKRPIALAVWILALLALHASAADDAEAKREKKIDETTTWLTNAFVPWLTNEFPEVTTKPYPEWFVNPFSKTRLPTWLTNTFPQIDTAADHIKIGSVTQSERLAKYNRLLTLEAEYGLKL